MPIIKNILRRGIIKLQELERFDVLINEEGVLGENMVISQYFNITDFPAPLTLGNSIFTLEGSDLLKPGVEVKTELLDKNNNPIYHYPVNKPDNQTQTRVAIEAYPGFQTGIGKLVILTELDPNNPENPFIPEEFQDTYNVRFVGTFRLDAAIRNTEEIIFQKSPKLTVREEVRGNVLIPSSDTESIISITGSGTFNGGSVAGFQYESAGTGPEGDDKTDDTDFNDDYAYSTNVGAGVRS